MRFKEYLVIILLSSGFSLLISAGVQFYFNNFQIVDSPFQQSVSMKPSESQETSEAGGRKFIGDDEETIYTTRDKQEGVGLYYNTEEEEQITYLVYNNNEFPVCVYAEVIAEENIDSAVFFTIPLYPDTDRILGIIRLVPDKEAFYVFNWFVTRNRQVCIGDVDI